MSEQQMYNYLTITGSDQSINLTTGSLLTFGGITSQCDANATDISNGGSFLTPGGASIGKDLYIGGNIYNVEMEKKLTLLQNQIVELEQKINKILQEKDKPIPSKYISNRRT